MKTIGDLLARDLTRKIEEIIKVDQTDEQSVYFELTEYVATDRIRNQYREILRAMAEAPSEPHEGVGVWISGFFGSGKSSFAKNLGYILSNRNVLGRPASDLFKGQASDSHLNSLIDSINARIPSEVIMFDVSVDRAVKKATERIAEIMYTVLLRELDYAEDYDVAELEIELEKEGPLEQFTSRCFEAYGLEWRAVRKGAQKISRASALLHSMDPATFPTPDAWAQSLRNKPADVTVGKFVERTFELMNRRRPGKAAVFVIDEVGQYVARSAEKIEDLRAVVEQFGRAGKNLVKARKAVAPVWIVVTSQEKLDEVVAALDSQRVELAKLQDRFKYRIDLAPADIREVATRRVLSKKAGAVPILKKLYQDSEGKLNAACRLERTSRRSDLNSEAFIQFYPYLPHFVELSIDIMSGIRLQPGAPRHLGGSNRTIIKQAYEMLISERTGLARQPIGSLVTLDKIFELVEGNLSTEKQKDISDIQQRFQANPEDRGMAARVAKTICLLEFVRDLPRTQPNIAACLVDQVGSAAPLAEVQAALVRLQEAQFVRHADDGWKLQSAQEKNWDTERRGFLQPKPKDRNEIVREVVRDIFLDPRLKTCRYRDLRSFRVGLRVDGSRAGDEGQVPLWVVTAESRDVFGARVGEVREESRQKDHQNDIYWVFPLTPEIDRLVAEVHASRQMLSKYQQLRAQNRITPEEAACLQGEEPEVLRLLNRTREKLVEALQTGTAIFRGVSRDGSQLGRTAPEIFKGLFDLAVPDLYPKLEMGARPLKGTEAEEFLKAANLDGLSTIFYAGEQGLNLVTRQGEMSIPNPSADVAKEILDYLNREHSYGNKDTRIGRALEGRFGGIGYGWELDLVRLVLAVLFRAGSIEVSHGGIRFDSYRDPRSRHPFCNTPAFRSSLFTPVRPIDLKTLTTAVENYEQLAGRTVDVEKNAITAAFKGIAEEELRLLIAVEALAKAHNLPVLSLVGDYHATLSAIQSSGAEDCVLLLAGEGRSFREMRDRMKRLREALNEQGMACVRNARIAIDEMWPVIEDRPDLPGGIAEAAQALEGLLGSEDFHEKLRDVAAASSRITAAYSASYTSLHARRAEAYLAAIEEIKGYGDWSLLSPELRQPLLQDLVVRACRSAELPPTRCACPACRAAIPQMESDLAAVESLKSRVRARLKELTMPEEKTRRVRVTDFFAEALDTEESIERALERLREHLLKLLAEGARIVVE